MGGETGSTGQVASFFFGGQVAHGVKKTSDWDEFNAAFRRFFVQIPGGEQNAGKTEAFCLFDPILKPGNGAAFARKTQFAQRDQIIRHRAVCQ